jgi:predicted DNA binding CopG/RHH family protein
MSDPEFDFEADQSHLIRGARPDVLPKPTPGGPRVNVPVRIAPDTLEVLKQLAEQRGVGHTTLMAEMVEAAVAELTAPAQAMIPAAEVRHFIEQLAARSRHPAA